MDLMKWGSTRASLCATTLAFVISSTPMQAREVEVSNFVASKNVEGCFADFRLFEPSEIPLIQEGDHHVTLVLSDDQDAALANEEVSSACQAYSERFNDRSFSRQERAASSALVGIEGIVPVYLYLSTESLSDKAYFPSRLFARYAAEMLSLAVGYCGLDEVSPENKRQCDAEKFEVLYKKVALVGDQIEGTNLQEQEKELSPGALEFVRSDTKRFLDKVAQDIAKN